jgi:cytosol aminopeptidase
MFKLPRSFLSGCLPRSSRYLTCAKTMSDVAYIVPYDHHSSEKIVDGVDASHLWSLTPQDGKLPKVGTVRTFYNTPPSNVTTLSSLGEGFASKKTEVKRELVRKSVGSAVKDLKAHDGLKNVLIDASADPHAAGALLYYFSHIYS